jgi:DNA-binding NtrC family response regulator
MKPNEKILIIDDDEPLIHFLSRYFERKGYDVKSCVNGRDAIKEITGDQFDLILLDYKMPELNGLDTLSKIKSIEVKTPVILMTAYGTTDLAIETMKRGAYDYLIKPFNRKDLTHIVNEALLVNRQMKEFVCVPTATPLESDYPDKDSLQIIGNSRKMQEIFKLIGQIAQKDISVLITGETGTGKELVARAIYHHSNRKEKPFIAINCAAIPESLFESELFGHERGAFTGAERTSIGKIERCNNGTLFLDEIGDLSKAAQSKLLRILQEGELERVGGNQTIKVNIRIIAATNKDLENEVKVGRFRNDLYWRLKVISLDLPPLRHRREDIPHLADYFLTRFSAEYNRPTCYLSELALNELISYSWPGNVRELENCIRRAVLLTAGEVITEGNLMIPGEDGEHHLNSLTCDQLIDQLKEKLEEIIPEILNLSKQDIHANIIELVEEMLIHKSMEACGGNQVQAAKMLGISRNKLRHRLKKWFDKKTEIRNDLKS